jgi:valyl-tRNA synthetase
MEKAYQPKKYESKILKKWDDAKIAQPETKGGTTGKSFTVPLPPPNVTGQLHLGHAMMLVIEDIMIRYHRMKGDDTLWVPGTDHAAIATETVVLKNLGVASREEFSRPEFLEKCFDHTAKTHATITNQVKQMGASCDFSRERFTMDLGMSNAVQKIFADLYKNDLIVRGHRMVNWSTGAQSVLADDELEYEDQKDTFCYIKCGKFVMGTVRSETKCADSPLVIHPEEKYVKARFVSSNVETLHATSLPEPQEFIFSEVLFDDIDRRNKIFNQLGEGRWEKISTHQGKEFEGEEFEDETYSGRRKFFVLCDDEVIDINKGTGAMTISVCHSADDYLLAKKYPEKLKDYYFEKIGFDGKMTALAGELEGVEVKIARKRALKLMLEKNMIVGLEKDYLHNVPLCYRTGCVVEPMISPQWFIDVNKEFDWQENVGVVSDKNVGAISNRPENNFIFIRHGESEDNEKNVIQSPTTPLTKKGKEHALQLVKELKTQNITKIISSPTIRAKETAEILSHEIGVEVELQESLSAPFCGNAIGTPKSEFAPLAPLEYAEKIGTGERYEDFFSRVKNGVEELRNTPAQEGKILVVSHRSVLSAIDVILERGNVNDAKNARRKSEDANHGIWGELKFSGKNTENNFETYIENISTLHQTEKGGFYSQQKKYTVGKISSEIQEKISVENSEVFISEFIYAKMRGWIPHLEGHLELESSDFYFLPTLLQRATEVHIDKKTQYRYLLVPSTKKRRTFLIVLDRKKENVEIVSFFYTNKKNKYVQNNTRFTEILKKEDLEGPASVPSCITSEHRSELKRLVAGKEVQNTSSFSSRQTLICNNIIEFFIKNQLIFSDENNPPIQKTSLKRLTYDAVLGNLPEEKKVQLIPNRFEKIYHQWIDNLQDWCISRQIWWGHQIPVWYDEAGNEHVAKEQKLLFTRHGQSEGNVQNLICGDFPLTEKGRIQAKELGERLLQEGRNITKIIVSPLGRASDTGKIVQEILEKNSGKNISFETWEELTELGAGKYEATPCLPGGKSIIETLFKEGEGESAQDLVNRAKKFWKKVEKINEEGEVLFVGHDTFMAMLFAVKDGATPENLIEHRARWKMDNCEVKEVTWMLPPKGAENFRQDEDTLDTWFSSALWPFSTLGWPDKTPDFEKFFPTSVLETGHDILFFWVARMIMFSLFATGKNPFDDVYLHGLVCDEHGKKMSKSKGNGIDPLEMIDKFGTDSVRMSLVVGSTPGNQVNLGEKKIEGFRNFGNKLWNVSRYILSLENSGTCRDAKSCVSTENISLPEQWILAKLNTLIEEVSTGIEKHQYGEVGQKLYDFTWNDLADWAIESAKAVESETIGDTLRFVLENLLKLLHPYIPFVTEQIWEEMHSVETLHATSLLALEDFPEAKESTSANIESAKNFEILKNVIAKIRSLRSASKVDPVKKIDAVLKGENLEFLEENKAIILLLARLENLSFGEKPTEECVEDLIDGTHIFLPLAGMIDAQQEKERKAKELEEAKKLLKNLEGRMANKKYMDNAPAHLVEQTKAQYEEVKEKIKVLEG